MHHTPMMTQEKHSAITTWIYDKNVTGAIYDDTRVINGQRYEHQNQII